MSDDRIDYSGMTVNERLYVAGLLEKFDAAARSRNRNEMLNILRKVDVESPKQTADAILENPKMYGY